MAEDRGTLYGHSIPDGPVVRPPADPERDARIKAYRARERAKVVAAFDRFLERMFNDPYGERPEWADPPVWLRTEAERRACATCGGPTSCGGSCDDCAAAHRERAKRCGDVYSGDSRYVCGQRSGHDGPHEYDDTAPTAPVGIHQKAHYGVPLDGGAE